MIVDVGTCDDPGTALNKVRRLRNDAATQMRDKCVEAVKAVPMPTHLSESGEEIVNHFRARIVRYLESLTLDQEKQR